MKTLNQQLHYVFHLILQSKFLPLVYLSFILIFSNILNTITLCETDDNNIIKKEALGKENDAAVALMLFVFSILFSLWVVPHILDGTLIERIVEIINEKPYKETYRPATPQEVLDWGEEWLKGRLGLEGKSDAEIHKILFGTKKK